MKKFLLLFSLATYLSIGQVPFQPKDINPTNTTPGLEFPTKPFAFNNKVIFSGNNNSWNEELWISDGTTPGTVLLKEMLPGTLGGSPDNFYIYNSKVIFTGRDNTVNWQLWITDGTTIGTNTISTYSLTTGGFNTFNNIVYYVSKTSTNGQELARTDGTTGGSYLLKDIWPGVGNANPSQLTSDGATKFYFVGNNGVNGEELWVSDGTSGGTQMVKDIYAGSASANISILKYTNNTLFFMANDGVNGKELWRSDGTLAGTYMLNDLTPGSGSSFIPYDYQVCNNKFFFKFGGNYIWETDGTIAGTFSSANIFATSGAGFLSNLYVFNNEVYFLSASMNMMWNKFDSLYFYKISSSVASINLYTKVKLTNMVPYTEYVSLIQTNNNKFIFISFDSSSPTNKHFLGSSNGTSGGTAIHSYSVAASPSTMFGYTNSVPYINFSWYYPLQTASSGVQLHTINANTGAVNLIKNIGTSSFCSSTWNYITHILNNKLFFIANDGTTGQELWVTDGTSGGTFMTADVYPGINGSIWGSDDSQFLATTSGNNLFWGADDGVTGWELWTLSTSPTEVKELNNFELVKVYPNPTNDVLKINSSSKDNSESEIINYLGQTVLKQKYAESIDVSKLSPGCYFIRIDNSYSKFIKE